MLYGDELSRLSDDDLKEFLSNLPLEPAREMRGGTSEDTQVDIEPAEDTLEQATSQEKGEAAKEVLTQSLAESKLPSGQHAYKPAGGDNAATTDSDATTGDELSSLLTNDAVEASVLLAAAASSRRGWQLGGVRRGDDIISGDLQELSRKQSDGRFSDWSRG